MIVFNCIVTVALSASMFIGLVEKFLSFIHLNRLKAVLVEDFLYCFYEWKKDNIDELSDGKRWNAIRNQFLI